MHDCVIAEAELKILDATDKTPEEKVQNLTELAEARMAFQLTVLTSKPLFDLSIPGPNAEYPMTDEMRDETLKRLENFMSNRKKQD